jgi:hypothetical protein
MVAPNVAQSVRHDYVKACCVVAGCAERVAQVFAGIRGIDPHRVLDVVYLLGVLDDLWLTAGVVPSRFEEHVMALLAFPELVPPDEDIIGTADVAAVYAALVVLHAAEFRATGDIDEALSCASATLTFLEMVDQNAVGSRLCDQENAFQLDDATGIPGRRESYRDVSRRSLMIVLSI